MRLKKISNKSFDRLADKLFNFEAKYGNKIAELVNDTVNKVDKVAGKEGEVGGEEYEEVEVPDWVMHGERGDAWQAYLAKHGITYDMLSNPAISDTVFALYTQFCEEWDQQPHPKRTMRVKKRLTEEEQAALLERIKKEREEAARHNFGFKD